MCQGAEPLKIMGFSFAVYIAWVNETPIGKDAGRASQAINQTNTQGEYRIDIQ